MGIRIDAKLKLTKSLIDDLKAGATEQVYWDQTLRGFGVKVTPSGRKVFIGMYRTTDSRRVLRKYTIGPYGVMTLFSARTAAQKILLARLDGQEPAAAKQAGRRRPAGLRVEEVIAQYKSDYLEPRSVGGETVRILERIMLSQWKGRLITEISRADVRELTSLPILLRFASFDATAASRVREMRQVRAEQICRDACGEAAVRRVWAMLRLWQWRAVTTAALSSFSASWVVGTEWS